MHIECNSTKTEEKHLQLSYSHKLAAFPFGHIHASLQDHSELFMPVEHSTSAHH